MNSNISGRERLQETAFAVGAFVGVLVVAIGIAVLVLAMSVGLRRGQEYLPPVARTVLLFGGVALVVGSIVVRLYRSRLTTEHESLLATGGVIGALIGAAMFLFAAAAETTVSAPFLASPRDKVMLFLIAYVFIAAGLLITRGAAKVVGW